MKRDRPITRHRAIACQRYRRAIPRSSEIPTESRNSATKPAVTCSFERRVGMSVNLPAPLRHLGTDSALLRSDRRTLPNLAPGVNPENSRVRSSLVGDEAPTGVGEYPRPFQLALCRGRLAVFIE